MHEPPDPLHQLPEDVQRALGDHLSRLRHDLGKYVHLQVRWLGPGASPEALREALAADLLETRRGPAGVVDAVALWHALRPPLIGAAPLEGGAIVDLSGDADVEAITHAMAQIARVIEALRRGSDDPETVDAGIAAARAVTAACRSLWSRIRGR